jgi:hypothetical protein
MTHKTQGEKIVEPEVEVTVMSDGTLRGRGPEPFTSDLCETLEKYFVVKGIEGVAARKGEIERLLASVDGATPLMAIQ